jgi:plasmid stability protein
MSVNLSIKNVPEDLVDRIRGRAVRNQRTLNQELLEILRQAGADQAPATMDDLLAVANRTKPALDETASKVLAAKDAEHDKVAKQFEDLLGG